MSCKEHYKLTQYGFEWGPMTVERLMHDDRYGWCLVVKAAGKEMIVRASPKGTRLSVEVPKGAKVYPHGELEG